MATSATWVPDRGEVIWIQFSPQASDREMRDPHPMLVLSAKAFNDRMSLVIGLPMTHAKANDTNPFAVKHVGPGEEVVYVLTNLVKSFDWRSRGARPHAWKKLPPSVFAEACEGLNSILQIG